MSTDKFEWTDEMVEKFLDYQSTHFAGLPYFCGDKKPFIEQFKQEQLKSKRDWEIVSFYDGCKNGHKDERCIRSALSEGYFQDNIIYGGLTIHSVRRLSDGEVFELHKTRVVDPNTKHEWVISYVSIKGNSLYFNGTNITHVQKVKKQPLFTTEDGVEIFEGETFYEVCISDGRASWSAIAESVLHKPPYDKHYKYFSTRQAAEEYILMNKPTLSVNDFIKTLGQCATDKYLIEELKQLAKSKMDGKK